MAATLTTHLSMPTIFTPTFRPRPRPPSPSILKPIRVPRCAMHLLHTRRSLLSSPALTFLFVSSLPHPAIADDLFDRYVKRKKLEPLETYVPAVILTELQIKDIEKSLEVDQPQYAAYRSALRSGPSASFRSNVRAVAQYASDGDNGKTAFDDVERCLRAIDELDSLFLRASRNNPAASAKLMKEKIGVAVTALDSLLQTVPSDVLDKGKAIAEAYRTPEPEMVPQELDRELKDLQSIL